MNHRRGFLLTGLVLTLAPALNAQNAPPAPKPAPEIRPTDNLVVQGVPTIPAALADEVKRYTESRAATLADWHPVNREMLIATRFANTAQIHRVKFPGGARTQLTFFDEPIGEALYEPKAGAYFLFTRDTGGNEFSQIYRYDLANGRVTLLTDGGRSQNGEIRWSTHGDRIAYASTRRNGADRDLYVMDPLDPKTDRLVLQVTGGGWSVLDFSPDDKTLLVGEEISINDTRLYLVDVAGGKKELLTPPGDETVAYGAAQFAKDGTALFVTTDKDSEFQRLARLDLKTKALTPLVDNINWDIEAMEPSPDGGKIAFVAAEAGVSKLYLFDVKSGKYAPVEIGIAGVISGLKWHPSGKELGFAVASARSSSDVYSVNANGQALTRWTESELGGLVASELSEPQLIKWKSFDQREISGFLYSPPARFAGKRPVMINIHGGPEGQARPMFLSRSNFYLNELGVAIIFPNVRGSVGYGKTFTKLDNALLREDSVKDIGALLDWIAQQPNLDAGRVMIMGGSYGGYMTLAVATHYNDRIRCALDVVGISNFNTFLKNTESYRRDLRRVEYGDERDPKVAEFFEKMAPLNNAAKITKPLFVVQGGNDPRVPHTEAEQMVERVRKNHTPVWYLMAKDEGHGFRKKGNADYQFYATVLFVQQYLLGTGGVRD